MFFVFLVDRAFLKKAIPTFIVFQLDTPSGAIYPFNRVGALFSAPSVFSRFLPKIGVLQGMTWGTI